jgi:DtxR family Mn-dependent transcriptional regulator
MSEAVERRLIELLDRPTESPYGNPIPGLDELGAEGAEGFMEGLVALDTVAGGRRVRIRRISEELQKDESLMSVLRRVGAVPDSDVLVSDGPVGLLIGAAGESAEIDHEIAQHIFVQPS